MEIVPCCFHVPGVSGSNFSNGPYPIKVFHLMNFLNNSIKNLNTECCRRAILRFTVDIIEFFFHSQHKTHHKIKMKKKKI